MSTNDHSIKIDDNKKGFRLIRDKGKALYSVIEDIPNYQQQFRFMQRDWVGGHGQYDFEQPDMYLGTVHWYDTGRADNSRPEYKHCHR